MGIMSYKLIRPCLRNGNFLAADYFESVIFRKFRWCSASSCTKIAGLAFASFHFPLKPARFVRTTYLQFTMDLFTAYCRPSAKVALFFRIRYALYQRNIALLPTYQTTIFEIAEQSAQNVKLLTQLYRSRSLLHRMD